jgi:hypothetical protein
MDRPHKANQCGLGRADLGTGESAANTKLADYQRHVVELANSLNTAEAKRAHQEHQLEQRGKAVAATNARLADREHELQ